MKHKSGLYPKGRNKDKQSEDVEISLKTIKAAKIQSIKTYRRLKSARISWINNEQKYY